MIKILKYGQEDSAIFAQPETAMNVENIVANHAVARVKKFPAAAPVNAPPNIDAADEPDMPEPSDFCNKIKPIIITATIVNITSNIENIFFPYVYLRTDFNPHEFKLQGFSTVFLPHLYWRPFSMCRFLWRCVAWPSPAR